VVKALDAAGEPVRGERRINEQQAAIVRRIFREFVNGASPRAIARRLNEDGIPGHRGKRWSDNTLRGHAARGTGLLNNELYVGRLVWNRQRRALNPETGRKVSRINPPEEWVVAEVPHLRILDDDPWQAAKRRQDESTEMYAAVITGVRRAHENPLNATHRPRQLLSGLLERGVCGGAYVKRGQDRYACSNHARDRRLHQPKEYPPGRPGGTGDGRAETPGDGRAEAPGDGAGGSGRGDRGLCRGNQSPQPGAPRLEA